MNEREETGETIVLEVLVEEVVAYMGRLLLAGMKRQRVLKMGYDYACDVYPTNGDWRDARQLGARTVLEATKVLGIDFESVEKARYASG